MEELENNKIVQSFNNKKIALAHDFLVTWGGAERVFKVMTDIYPEAPIYTLFYDEVLVRERFPGREIRTSFLQKLPKWLRQSPLLMPLYPVAIETLDLRDFDTVLSSSGAWMKGLVTRLHTRHIAYLHSPMRFAWDTFHEHPGITSGVKFFKRLLISYLRLWDKEAADRPDILLVNSEYTKRRVAKYYRRDSQVVYPPLTLKVEQRESAMPKNERPFLVVARLTASKHVDIVVEAFNKLGLPLKIIGTGRENKSLRSLAGSQITFLGVLSDEALRQEYAVARALIQPSEEDFGLVALEALAFGVPVIAYKEGAAREIVTPGETGELFDDLVPESVADGVRRFVVHEEQYRFAPEHLEGFSRDAFAANVRKTVDSLDA